MHYYAFSRISSLLKIKKTTIFYIIVLILALSFPLMSFIERSIDGKTAAVFYTASAVWLGAIFFLFCTLLVYEIINPFAKIPDQAAGIFIIILALLLTIYSLLNALPITTKEIRISMPNLEKEIKIVQLSDIHIGTIHNSGYLKRVVEKTNSLNPDLILITGDLVDGSGILKEESISHLSELNSQTFFSLGNHEQFENIDEIMRFINKTGVKVLRNELINWKNIQIIGIDNGQNLKDILKTIKINNSKPSILMYHSSTGLKDSSEAGINLQLSGHTHDGQIYPFNLFVMPFYPKMKGLYKYNNTNLYVSPGTGTWGPPFRLGSKNEITLIRLVPNSFS